MFELKMFEIVFLVKAFTSTSSKSHPKQDGHVRLNVNHKFHDLQVGDEQYQIHYHLIKYQQIL